MAWETNALFWDDYMGDESNFFHCDMVRPKTDEFLQVSEGDLVLDIACGNGNYSEWMAAKGAKVVAFDYSEKMVELAKRRRTSYADRIKFSVCDAADSDALMRLSLPNEKFSKAVANMAIMDISDIVPLFKSVAELLSFNGIFVFSFHHPCFTFPNGDYLSSSTYKGVAVEGQPIEQCYFHRSLQDVLSLAFNSGFVLDKFAEIPFEGEKVPIIAIVRLRKR